MLEQLNVATDSAANRPLIEQEMGGSAMTFALGQDLFDCIASLVELRKILFPFSAACLKKPTTSDQLDARLMHKHVSSQQLMYGSDQLEMRNSKIEESRSLFLNHEHSEQSAGLALCSFLHHN